MALKEMLGESVLKGTEEVATSSLGGGGKVVGLYFSGHWCPPCKMFTPQLATFYNKVKGTANAANFEIVFISSDGDADSFKEYYDSMPWLALPFEKRDLKKQLADKFEVRGIPMFILLDGDTGEVITKEGRAVVYSDTEGTKFPWKS